jgi:hypothetical protein
VSYGYLLMKIARRFTSTADLSPGDEVPIGSAADIAEAVSSVFPGVRWDEDSRAGKLDLDHRWFEFFIGDDDPAMSLSVRTSFRHESADVVERLCDAFGWVAFDGQAGKFFAPANVDSPGDRAWHDFN